MKNPASNRFLIRRPARELVVAISLMFWCVQLSGQISSEEAPLQMLGTIHESDVTESSGLAISGANREAFWTHNDSGHAPNLFLIATTGKSIARCDLKLARNIDWEAMSSFRRDDKPWLMVADVGDNSLNREKCQIYLLREPELPVKQSSEKVLGEVGKRRRRSAVKIESKSKTIEFTYADGAHNVEAAAVTPDGKSIWFIEKIYSNDPRPANPGFYVLPLKASDFETETTSSDSVRTATRLADYPIRNVTGMAFSPDGRRLVVRNYLNAHVYTRGKGQTWEETVVGTKPTPIVLPIQSQGEAICFTSDSKSVLITSEFKRSTIWQVRLPAIEP